MRILMVHNFYREVGGEDLSVQDEKRVLTAQGHEVLEYSRHNDEIGSRGATLNAAWRAVWNPLTYREVRKLIRRQRPDVVHVTNTFPLISPAVNYAARAEGIPVVQALRNYRLICPNGFLFREGKPCHDCLGKRIPWPAIQHGCYRESRSASTVSATVIGVHRALRSWLKTVNCFFSPSEYARKKMIGEGLPADRFEVLPNFLVTDPGRGTGASGNAVFVGRLSPEKGLRTVVEAWRKLRLPQGLRIIGDGTEAPLARQAANEMREVEWLGRLPWEETLSEIGKAAFLIMPSLGAETFGRTVAEAFAKGTPVVASRRGPLPDLVEEGRNGLLFTAGDPGDLARKIQHLKSLRGGPLSMRPSARQAFKERFGPEAGYQNLLRIYRKALKTTSVPATDVSLCQENHAG